MFSVSDIRSMKAVQSIGGSLLMAALAGSAVVLARHRTALERKAEEEQFYQCALCTFEGEGGLVLS